jgi:alpha-tubulin suppressor-like RCC1 family protein
MSAEQSPAGAMHSPPSRTSPNKRNRTNCYLWGWGGQGQLGMGDIQSKVSPVNVRSKGSSFE